MSRLGLSTSGAAMVLALVATFDLSCGSACAQDGPAASGRDLTLPPGMRDGASSMKQAHKPDLHPRAARASTTIEAQGTTKRHAAVADTHPIDLGVTVRGGSATPRVFGATGTSEAIQESGSAFGAAMRFGF